MRNLRQACTQWPAFLLYNTHSHRNMREYIPNIDSNEETPLRYGANTEICKETRGSIYLGLAASVWLGFQLAVRKLTSTNLKGLGTSLVMQTPPMLTRTLRLASHKNGLRRGILGGI